MTQVHFTLKQPEIQKMLEGSVKDELSLNKVDPKVKTEKSCLSEHIPFHLSYATRS